MRNGRCARGVPRCKHVTEFQKSQPHPSPPNLDMYNDYVIQYGVSLKIALRKW